MILRARGEKCGSRGANGVGRFSAVAGLGHCSASSAAAANAPNPVAVRRNMLRRLVGVAAILLQGYTKQSPERFSYDSLSYGR